MELAQQLANLGALATMGLGVMAVVSPARAAAFTSIAPVGRIGVSEIRATYGGLFVGLGLFCLVTQASVAFAVVGTAWLGAAAGRALSVVIDASREARNFGGIAFEAAIGLLSLAGMLA